MPSLLSAEPLTATIPAAPAPAQETFRMGTARNPQGVTLTLDSRSLLRDGKPWTPVMGEFHYSRYPESEWREELLKIKAGGIDILATYVFWSHHEEIEGRFDWSGRRNLRAFIQTCHEVGLTTVVRCGPWCHGEVRNGGIPDWALNREWKVRTDDPGYLEKARILYREIAAQLDGLLWKDGGPVVAVQLENEYGGPAEHLLSLKKIAREVGLDAPYYTRTGWPGLRTPMPFGEILPLYGVYAEGFWDREITAMPGNYWAGFHFSLLREDANIANEALGKREAKDGPDVHRYPYLTCEMGGGMMSAYHRRIRMYPADIESTTLVKLGSGSNLPGYYMYHGGTNPVSHTGITLEENQSTVITNWNDMPTMGYDFQAPLGEFGQIRPHYHLLRRLHLFLRDFGASLATMPPVLPDQRPAGRDDLDTLRWSVRSDGRSGYVFVNNYERLKDLPAKSGVQFSLKLADGALTFPAQPVDIPAGARFVWPFNLELGQDARLIHATAQLVCFVDDDSGRTFFFAETPGVPAEFLVEGGKIESALFTQTNESRRSLASRVRPSNSPFATIATASGHVRLVLLNEADSLALWKGHWLGRDRAFQTRAGLVIDGERVRLTASQPADLSVSIYPAVENISASAPLAKNDAGLGQRFTAAVTSNASAAIVAEKIRDAGPARTIPLGRAPKPVAAAPLPEDFEQAAVWRIRFPENVGATPNPLLRVRYTGDVARFTLNGRVVTDQFYYGEPFDLGLARLGSLTANDELLLWILPLSKDAPIHLPTDVNPAYDAQGVALSLDALELVPRHTVELTAPAKR